MKTKLMTMILAAGAMLGAFGETVDLETLTAAYVAQDGDMLIGTLAGNHKISIAAGATVMLRDVAINGDDSSAMAAVTCEGDAILILGATNSVKGFSGFPGILVPAGKTLTIEGEGSLVAIGGGDGAAGIGGSYSSGDCGNISIEGGVITAFGGSGAPGIGCAASSQCGTITITGGLVTSVGRGHACGIGHGYNYNGDSRCSGVVIGPGIIRVVAIGGGSPSYPAIGADSVTVNNNLYDRSEQDVIDGDKRIIELLDAPIDVSVTFVENYTGGGQTEVWMSDTGFVLKKAPEVPVRSGWAFAGWFTAAEGGTQVDEWTRPGYGATYYAHWIKGEFTTFPSYGDKIWVPQKDGSWRTENIDYPKNACLERTVTGPGTLSFEWKAASRFDDMEGAIYLSIDGKNTYTKIQSTDKEWHSLSVPIEDGSHVVKLSFSVGDGSDALGYGATRNWQMTASGDATVTPDVSITAGEYFKATLAELGYDVPTDGKTAYTVKAYGLPAGLKLVGNKAVTKKDKKGKKVVVTPANVEWWIEGVPTAALDYATNPPYLVITIGGVAQTLPLSLGVEAQEVTELDDLMLGDSLNEQFYLPGVTNGWTVSGLPTGLKYTAKLVTTTKKKGKKIISVTTNALPFSVYGKTTKAGLFTITAKKKVNGYYETLKFRVLVRPAPVDTAIFGNELTNIVTMAYVPFEWDLTNDVAAVGGKVAKVAGLPAGLAFASATTYKDKKKTQVKQYGQTIVGKPTKPGTYVVTFTKNVTTGTGKKKKTVAKTAQILWVVEPNDVEPELDFNTAGGEIVSGSVGLKYGDLMAFSATSNATVKASGLPKGITLANLGDGQYAFKGFTAKAGTYLVTVTATLNGKTVTQRVALKVDGLPDWAKGSFNGTVIYSKDIFAGLATMSVTAAGKISGKFQEFGTNWTFSASSYTNYNETESMYSATVTAKYAYKVKEKVKGKWKNVTKYLTREFTFDIAEDRGGGFGGVVLMRDCNDEADIRINAYQNLWGRSDYKALGKRIFWTSKKKPYKEFSDFVDVEGTSCPISLKITSSGAVTATLTFDTGKTKKNKKTKKVEPVYYKPSCTTVVIQQTAADADPFRGEIILYFAPSAGNNFPGYADHVTVQP